MSSRAVLQLSKSCRNLEERQQAEIRSSRLQRGGKRKISQDLYLGNEEKREGTLCALVSIKDRSALLGPSSRRKNGGSNCNKKGPKEPETTR